MCIETDRTVARFEKELMSSGRNVSGATAYDEIIDEFI